MSKYADIKELIRKIAGTGVGGNGLFFTAKVTAVNGNVCKVDVGGLEVSDVRLLSVAEGADNGILITPKIGSIVTVVDFGSMQSFQVIGYGDVDNIKIMGGTNGGLCKTPELKTQLDKLTARVDTIINALNNAQATPQDGGSALIAMVKTTLSTITQKEDFAQIENDKIKH